MWIEGPPKNVMLTGIISTLQKCGYTVGDNLFVLLRNHPQKLEGDWNAGFLGYLDLPKNERVRMRAFPAAYNDVSWGRGFSKPSLGQGLAFGAVVKPEQVMNLLEGTKGRLFIGHSPIKLSEIDGRPYVLYYTADKVRGKVELYPIVDLQGKVREYTPYDQIAYVVPRVS